jgi:hypothetical protein
MCEEKFILVACQGLGSKLLSLQNCKVGDEHDVGLIVADLRHDR